MIPTFRVVSKVQILAETVDYNHQLMNVPAMWRDTKGSPVKVAILDTGCVENHNDLTVSGRKTFVPGYEFDGNGHGTHCAGIVAAIAKNNMGVAGIAPECEDFHGTVLDKDGSGSIPTIVEGIMWAVDDIGAHIISMSLGIPDGYANFKELEDACIYAREQGVAVICAAGNENSGVGQPACYDSTIAVAAVDSQRERAWFSNQGKEIDFAAGGVEVYSTYLNNGYAKLSGTSMACPALVGVAALILADEVKDHDKWMTPDELVEKMKRICFDPGAEGFDKSYGHGIPMFRSGNGEPDEPETGEPPPGPTPEPDPPSGKKSAFPCGLTWKLMAQFADGADKAARAGADPDGAILAGFQTIGEFAKKASEKMGEGNAQESADGRKDIRELDVG
jgi:subtilisin